MLNAKARRRRRGCEALHPSRGEWPATPLIGNPLNLGAPFFAQRRGPFGYSTTSRIAESISSSALSQELDRDVDPPGSASTNHHALQPRERPAVHAASRPRASAADKGPPARRCGPRGRSAEGLPGVVPGPRLPKRSPRGWSSTPQAEMSRHHTEKRNPETTGSRPAAPSLRTSGDAERGEGNAARRPVPTPPPRLSHSAHECAGPTTPPQRNRWSAQGAPRRGWYGLHIHHACLPRFPVLAVFTPRSQADKTEVPAYRIVLAAGRLNNAQARASIDR